MSPRIRLVLIVVAITAIIAPFSSHAAIGVGIGSGKIVLQEAVKPGGVYTLPSVPVLNTGDETSDYAMTIEYLQDQEEFMPSEDWFSFEPATFPLDPKHSQVVNITLSVPVKAKPGGYFAYIEVHPVQVATVGVSRVGIAAAAKLYFTVEPANIFVGVYYRILSLITRYSPWTYIAFALIGIAVLIRLIRKYFSFNIAISTKKKEAEPEPDEESTSEKKQTKPRVKRPAAKKSLRRTAAKKKVEGEVNE
jgi:hypothetical protein